MIVYVAQNRLNGKVYVGKTTAPLEERWRLHLVAVKQGSQYAFHRAIRKYGAESFLVCTVTSALNLEELSRLEEYYIAKFHSDEEGYNMTLGGEPGWVFVNALNKLNHPRGMKGKRHSNETRARMRKAHAGLVDGEKHPMWKKKHTPEAKARIAESVRLARQKKFWSSKPTA